MKSKWKPDIKYWAVFVLCLLWPLSFAGALAAYITSGQLTSAASWLWLWVAITLAIFLAVAWQTTPPPQDAPLDRKRTEIVAEIVTDAVIWVARFVSTGAISLGLIGMLKGAVGIDTPPALFLALWLLVLWLGLVQDAFRAAWDKLRQQEK